MSPLIRRADDRGATRLPWLDSRHSFSFGDYLDPAHMGFGPLRVINEDRVAGGGGFPTHAHRDMEILTWVLAGALAHRDSLGTGSVIGPGELQRMSAGTGIRHSEFNARASEPVHFLQIWIVPDRPGHPPSYAQQAFPPADRAGRLRLIASGDGRDGSVALHRDADLWAATLDAGTTVRHPLALGRSGWLQVTGGCLRLPDGTRLAAGDGAAFTAADAIAVEADGPVADLLLFDLG